MAQITFDDLDGLRARITDEPGAFGPPTVVSQSMIDGFAELTGDRQWIHTDPARAAAESPFGGTIAHGFLVLSLLPALADGGETTITGYATVVNYGADKLRFVSPVRAGAQVRCRRRIVDAARKGEGTLVTVESEVWADGADKPALVYRSLALYLG